MKTSTVVVLVAVAAVALWWWWARTQGKSPIDKRNIELSARPKDAARPTGAVTQVML